MLGRLSASKPLMECHSTSERSTVSFRTELTETRKGATAGKKKC